MRQPLYAAAALLGCVAGAPAIRPTVSIASGAVVGTATMVSTASAVPVNRYLGIPFAQSPPERFSPPINPADWTEPLDASKFKDACVQQFNYPEASRNFSMTIFNNPGGAPPVESEDCLYLNVFTPATKAPAGGRTVMFWIYGGDLQFGTASLSRYDGSSFAANQDVVVVTTNYRTNVFGFSNSPEIATGKQNAGFLDQRKALDWVQQNIEQFGGDPTKVTIFGESAGGYSVKQLLAVPPSPRPYRGAILESEAASFTENGLTSWESLVALLNCTTATSQITCVQSKPATTIKNEIEMNMLDFAPAYDNVTAVQDVRQSIITKEFADVPFFLGTNANEGRVLATAAGIGANTSQDLIEPFLNVTFPGNVSLQNAILAAYPNSLTKNAYEFISQILTDETFLCPSAALADLAVMNGYDVWRYYFNATFPNTQSFPDAGVYHSSEIPEVFGTYPTINETTQEVKLSQYIQRAWANFAKNPSNGPGWPRLGTNLGVELGDLGGDCIDGEKTIQRSTVDAICAVYAPVIAAMPL